MGIPQIIVLVIYMIALGMSLGDDGKVKMKKESFWLSLVSVGTILALLWWGGFFGELTERRQNEKNVHDE